MDSVLSEFVVRTSTDPALATDLLNAHQWNLQSALSAYYVMKGLLPGEVPARRDSITLKPSLPTVAEANDSVCEPTFQSSNSAPFQLFVNTTQEKSLEPIDNCKKLTRGFSRATDNLNLINQARTEFAQDFIALGQEAKCPSSKLEIPDHTFTLPNILSYPASLQEYLRQDLIETATLVSLEQAGRLNWWYEKRVCPKLWPLATTGDGNCLLHAASLGMWGFHDRLLTLRKALHNLLTSSTYADAFYRRWRWQTSLQNKEAGLIYSEEEWEREWKNLLKISSTEPRTKYTDSCSATHHNGIGAQGKTEEKLSNTYESLEELHVFALAHVLKRPIIIIADTMLKDLRGEPFAPIPFGGIYLPLECLPSECHRSPLCLAYDSAHFSALVPMDDDDIGNGDLPLKDASPAIPVTDPENKLLHLHFFTDPGREVNWGRDENDFSMVSRLSAMDEDKLLVLSDYLDIRSFPLGSLDEILPSKSNTLKLDSLKDVYKRELDYDSDDGTAGSGMSCTGGKSNKSKAARQFQTVAKQFGSIGKSVSKKLKHIGHLARQRSTLKSETKAFRQVSNFQNGRNAHLPVISQPSTENNESDVYDVIVALLHTEKKHEYQKQIIQNYLNSAVSRFEQEKEMKANGRISEGDQNGTSSFVQSQCVNPGCTMFGRPTTSYLCSACYSSQRHKEEEEEFQKRHGALWKQSRYSSEQPVFTFGKSSFYTERDDTSVEAVHKIPWSKPFSEKPAVRWDGSNFCDRQVRDGAHTCPAAFLRDCKERQFCMSEGVPVNVLRESATS